MSISNEPHPNRDRHMAFLQSNLDDIMARSAEAYQEYGRGLWVFSDNDQLGVEEEGSTGLYIDDLSTLPQDALTERLRGMVNKYDPAFQAVVLLRDEAGDHAYTISSKFNTLRSQAGTGKTHMTFPTQPHITMPANREAAIARLKALEGDTSHDAEWERAAIVHMMTEDTQWLS